jgi:hypothetical protein
MRVFYMFLAHDLPTLYVVSRGLFPFGVVVQ